MAAVGWKAEIAPPWCWSEGRVMAQKVCPVVYRVSEGFTEILAFHHPLAGKQFVKGGIEAGETALDAAIRELKEESGITAVSDLIDFGEATIGSAEWHFFALTANNLPHRWSHQTQDDFGHIFSFFWHPVAENLGEEWHPLFHEALEIIRRFVPG